MSEAWWGYERGPQNSGENSPVLWSGVSGQKHPGRKEIGPERITPLSATVFFSLLFLFFPDFLHPGSLMKKKSMVLSNEPGKRGS